MLLAKMGVRFVRSLRPLALLSLAAGIVISIPGCFFLPTYWMPGGFSSTYRSHLTRQVTRENEELDQKIRDLEEPSVVEQAVSRSFETITTPFRSDPPSDPPPSDPQSVDPPPAESSAESPKTRDLPPAPKPDPADTADPQ